MLFSGKIVPIVLLFQDLKTTEIDTAVEVNNCAENLLEKVLVRQPSDMWLAANALFAAQQNDINSILNDLRGRIGLTKQPRPIVNLVRYMQFVQIVLFLKSDLSEVQGFWKMELSIIFKRVFADRFIRTKLFVLPTF